MPDLLTSGAKCHGRDLIGKHKYGMMTKSTSGFKNMSLQQLKTLIKYLDMKKRKSNKETP